MGKFFVFVITFCTLFSAGAFARDSALHLSISDAMASKDFQEKLNAGVKFYFGKQSYSVPKATMGEYITNKKTNAFGKSDEEACRWVLLSALISLQDRALSEGGNAVVDIVSYYKKNEYASDTQFECHTGAVIAGVALKGRVVTLP